MGFIKFEKIALNQVSFLVFGLFMASFPNYIIYHKNNKMMKKEGLMKERKSISLSLWHGCNDKNI